MKAGEYEPAVACFSICLDQKAAGLHLLGTAVTAVGARHRLGSAKCDMLCYVTDSHGDRATMMVVDAAALRGRAP